MISLNEVIVRGRAFVVCGQLAVIIIRHFTPYLYNGNVYKHWLVMSRNYILVFDYIYKNLFLVMFLYVYTYKQHPWLRSFS